MNTTPSFPADWTVDVSEGVATAPAMEVPLTNDRARITPIWTDTAGVQFSIELPDEPLGVADVETLAHVLLSMSEDPMNPPVPPVAAGESEAGK